MELSLDARRYRIRGFTPILGSQPADPDIRTKYLLEKNNIDEAENEDIVPNDEKGLTVFLRDTANRDALYIRDYMIKGFIKEALDVLRSQIGIKAVRGKLDSYLFVDPIKVYILRDGEPIRDEDSVYERPLRAKTMQGDRVALASSEQIDDPWTLEFGLTLVDNEGTRLSRKIDWDAVEMALKYGRLKGLGQFRNGGFGRFMFERL